jgi:uncharacterized protein YigE (DUF2233 family)
VRVIVVVLFLFSLSLGADETFKLQEDKRIISHIVDPKESELKLYLKDDNGTILKTFKNLKSHLKKQNKELLFAMNGGMYMENSMPLGLYVEKGKRIKKANRVKKAFGNFYMQPNGVFFITKKRNAYIKKTTNFRLKEYVDFATQSGPMLLIDGKMHPRFMKGSKNIHIRNGVGILEDGRVLFAISTELINFYDFATFFKNNGCKNALYFDGAISDIYLPPKHEGYGHSRFGVMVAEVKTIEKKEIDVRNVKK